MAEWEEAFYEWEGGEYRRYLQDNVECTKVDAFRAGARWMEHQASTHLGAASQPYIKREDEATHLLIAHLHTYMEVECLRDLGEWGNQEDDDG